MSEPLPARDTTAATAGDLAPVVLFCYMRPEHLARTVDSLQRNPEAARTHLRVYCDAARKPEHQAAVDAVRRYVATITGFASVTPMRARKRRVSQKSTRWISGRSRSGRAVCSRSGQSRKAIPGLSRPARPAR